MLILSLALLGAEPVANPLNMEAKYEARLTAVETRLAVVESRLGIKAAVAPAPCQCGPNCPCGNCACPAQPAPVQTVQPEAVQQPVVYLQPQPSFGWPQMQGGCSGGQCSGGGCASGNCGGGRGRRR